MAGVAVAVDTGVDGGVVANELVAAVFHAGEGGEGQFPAATKDDPVQGGLLFLDGLGAARGRRQAGGIAVFPLNCWSEILGEAQLRTPFRNISLTQGGNWFSSWFAPLLFNLNPKTISLINNRY